jgi:rhodanese-related sulfurtransferase
MHAGLALLTLLALLAAGGCGEQGSRAVQGAAGAAVIESISPGQATALIEKHRSAADLVILDVRTAREVSRGILENAVHLDYHAPDFEEQLRRLDRKRTYLVYCAVGSRSARALKLMDRLGFEEVYHMTGGLLRWKAEGLPVKP